MIAEAVAQALVRGKMIDVFLRAGKMRIKTAELADEYEVLFNKFANDPKNEESRNQVEEMEAKFAATGGYDTSKEKGDQQVEYLKALDFVDS